MDTPAETAVDALPAGSCDEGELAETPVNPVLPLGWSVNGRDTTSVVLSPPDVSLETDDDPVPVPELGVVDS